MKNTIQTPQTATTAPNARRPFWFRRNTLAAAAILTGGALMAADAYSAATNPDAALIHGALGMAAAALVARGALEVRPRYVRPRTTAARMD